MVNPLEVSVLMLFVAAILFFVNQPIRRASLGLVAVTLSLVMVLGFNLPAQAAGAAMDDAITGDQKALNNVLESTPNGNQFQGIEYAEVPGKPLSDEEIERKIHNDISDDIATSVSNGAVRLSGEVKNKRVAQRIVDEVKQIPGVHEITFDLGLADISTELQR
ncbi:MAG TPA: BON domain-containing protein [Leptolyngbyaceae cyanobacterium]